MRSGIETTARIALVGATLFALGSPACSGGFDASGSGGAAGSSGDTGSGVVGSGATASSGVTTGVGGGAGTTTHTASSTGVGPSTSVTTGSGGAGTGTGGTGAGAGGSGAGGGPRNCTWGDNSACQIWEYCDAPSCGAGLCTPIGDVEDASRSPVCGCDGITYWNTSVASRNGMSVASSGECPQGLACGGFIGQQCPNGASCNYSIASKAECNTADLGGSCWMMPASCSIATIGPNTRACGSLSCTDECDLIKLMVPWYVDSSCPL